jgi:hypothetical protein
MKRKSSALAALPTDDINAVVVLRLSVFQKRLLRHTPPPTARARMYGDVGIFFGNAMYLDC